MWLHVLNCRWLSWGRATSDWYGFRCPELSKLSNFSKISSNHPDFYGKEELYLAQQLTLVNYAFVTSNGSPTPSSDSKESLALQCVEVLGRLAALFEERRRQLAEGGALTVQQWQALEEVALEHFMPSLFAQRRASSAAAVSKILRQLTDKGLITAHVSEKDGRQRQYVVTADGQKILTRVREERQRVIDELWLQLSREDLQSFYSVGSVLAEQLDKWATPGRLQNKE